MNWRAVGVPHGWRSLTVLAILVVAGLAWIGWPVWGSLSNPSRAQAQAEAPWLMASLVGGLACLTIALWLDAGRRYASLAPLAGLVALDVAIRAVLNPAANGVEFVHAVPLIAGMAAGAPAGFLVGASAALASTIMVGQPATTLPTQALVWGLVGTLGGLLWRAAPRTAWLWSMPLALAAGVMSGVLLNLMGWGQEPGTTLTSFFPGLAPTDVMSRLWAYSASTSLVLDLTRGATTAAILACVGHPLLVSARRGAGSPAHHQQPRRPHQQIRPESLARREDSDRLDHLWS